MTRSHTFRALLSLAVLSLVVASPACAQLFNPTTPAQVPNSSPPGVSQASPEQVRDAMWLRALQSRSGGNGGGVQRGVPQFIPFGNFMGMPLWQQQGAAATPADNGSADAKTNADKRAAFEAARAERKEKARQRAEKRKAEAAARRAAARAGAQAAGDPPAVDPAQP